MKYHAQRVKYDGFSFASKLEAAVYQLLKLRESAGAIEVRGVQKRVLLSDAEIAYIPDFVCVDTKTDREFFVEAKGFETPAWRIKRKLWLSYGPGPLEIWQGSHLRPVMTEILFPKARG